MRFQIRKYQDNFDFGLFGRPISDVFNDSFFNAMDSNIVEKENGYYMEIAVPGMSKNDLSIHVEGDVLSVSGQSTSKRLYSNSRSMEFNSKQFARSFTLPPNADIDQIQSKCRNGLLQIEIPKLKAFKSNRHIMIEDAEYREMNDSVVNQNALMKPWFWAKEKLKQWILK